MAAPASRIRVSNAETSTSRLASITYSSRSRARLRSTRRRGRSPTSATRVIPAVTEPSTSAPMPTAVPTAAVTHRLAAVVRPRMLAPYLMMAPPPRKPMPTTICEAILVGSAWMACVGPSPTTDWKP